MAHRKKASFHRQSIMQNYEMQPPPVHEIKDFDQNISKLYEEFDELGNELLKAIATLFRLK